MNTCVFSSSSLVAGPEKPGSGPNRSRHGSRPARREARSRRASEASSEGLARAGAAGDDTGPERPLTEEAEREGCWKRCATRENLNANGSVLDENRLVGTFAARYED
jgi:hypothetical protein